MIKNKRCRLDRDDLGRMADMLEGQEPEKQYLRAEYARVLREIANGMSWDDRITTDGNRTEVTHG